MCLDVAWDSRKENAKVIVWPKKIDDNENQLWAYDNGYLISKNSGLVIDVAGALESDKQIIQHRRKMIEDAQNQRWYYREDGFIYPQVNPNLVLDIRGNWSKPGSPVLLYERKYADNENQLWDLVPFVEKQGRSSLVGSPETRHEGEEDYTFSTSSYVL
ncbi:ricin B lectin domain-containing protein [Dichotomocladium elegans]|nr:ricin B lectin domain-containing protein [Dichotomocladium elegans]